MFVRIGLWLVATVDVLALLYLVALLPGADAFHVAAWLLADVLLAVQLGVVFLALRWRARTAPAAGLSLPAFVVLVLALIIDILGLSGGMVLLAHMDRLQGLGTLAWTLANAAALVAAWRWRSWARVPQRGSRSTR